MLNHIKLIKSGESAYLHCNTVYNCTKIATAATTWDGTTATSTSHDYTVTQAADGTWTLDTSETGWLQKYDYSSGKVITYTITGKKMNYTGTDHSSSYSTSSTHTGYTVGDRHTGDIDAYTYTYSLAGSVTPYMYTTTPSDASSWASADGLGRADAVQTVAVAGNAAGTCSYTWSELPAYLSGAAAVGTQIHYKVVETPVNGYSTTYDTTDVTGVAVPVGPENAKAATITNTLRTTALTVTKLWVDPNGISGEVGKTSYKVQRSTDGVAWVDYSASDAVVTGDIAKTDSTKTWVGSVFWRTIARGVDRNGCLARSRGFDAEGGGYAKGFSTTFH